MRSALFATLLALSAPAWGQSEDEILRYAEEGQAEMKAGRLPPLQYYKELHRRIAITPGEAYKWKAENLRMVGRRIDLFEEVEAGKITMEKARRVIIEEQAGAEEADRAARQANVDAHVRAAQERERRNEQAAAQDEANRRALVLQMLQGQQRPAYQPIQPYVMPTRPAVNCYTEQVGNGVQTRCQ